MNEKILNIKPELIDHQGDCYGLCIMKLFEYYGKAGFENIFQLSYKVVFNNNGKLDGFDGIETFRKVNVEEINYQYELEKKYRLTLRSIYFISDDKIIYQINNNKPVIIIMSGLFVPWTNVTREGPHCFLIVGYNLELKKYICYDPYYSDTYVNLPFDIIPEACSKMSFVKMEVWNFDNFKADILENKLKNSIEKIYKKIELYPASKAFNELNSAIQNNSMFFNQSFFAGYTLSNEELLQLSFRFARLSSYFRYLHNIYQENWLLEISKIYYNCYKTSRVCMELFLKYRFGGKQTSLETFLEKIYSFGEAEAYVEFLCNSNLQGL